MLTRLLPDQVSKFWDIIKYAIEESIPPIATNDVNLLNNILMSILSNKTQCWASYEKNEKENKFIGIVLTRIMYDDASDTKSLLLYVAYGYSKVDPKYWMEGLTTTLKFAKSRGCKQIVAYSDLDYLADMAKQYGGTVKHFISFNIDEIVKKFNVLV